MLWLVMFSACVLCVVVVWFAVLVRCMVWCARVYGWLACGLVVCVVGLGLVVRVYDCGAWFGVCGGGVCVCDRVCCCCWRCVVRVV